MLQRKIALALVAVGLGAGITCAQTILPVGPGTSGLSAQNTPFDAGPVRDKDQAG